MNFAVDREDSHFSFTSYANVFLLFLWLLNMLHRVNTEAKELSNRLALVHKGGELENEQSRNEKC